MRYEFDVLISTCLLLLSTTAQVLSIGTPPTTTTGVDLSISSGVEGIDGSVEIIYDLYYPLIVVSLLPSLTKQSVLLVVVLVGLLLPVL